MTQKRLIQNLMWRVWPEDVTMRGPEEWRSGYLAGFIEGRETQRNADIEVVLGMFSPTEQTDGK
jgi:hypothetical protein